MKKTPLLVRQILLAVVSIALSFGTAWADDNGTDQNDAENSGLTILNNATNVTHWGLGAGVGFGESPYSGYGTKVVPFPLVTFDNKWVHVQATTVDVKIGSWSGVSLALRGYYSLRDGYNQSDAPILNGMEDRKGAFWYGPALAWHTAYGTVSGSYLLGGNKGERARIDYSKAFDIGDFSITPHVGVEWLSSDYVDYYYGVRPSEARPGRPAYTGTATWNTSVGTSVVYRLTKQQRIALNVGVSHLGNGITDSPLVGKRFIPEISIGYNYQFR
ncbi:MipA/OmpV family protein [Paraburkholderia susongensis]|uniref:Outer membrane protein n=1 Tax=Paraburkholderia susongensis TaxID=1515439 RepID=A0A1X7M2K7_9BURK|nr:MipA/OmpV family protein [Paraburkholderia susongensis]SMG59742.1 outer membrane protein [Paraburkholderia susongensis]